MDVGVGLGVCTGPRCPISRAADRWAELTAEDTYLDGLRAWWTACWPADRRARAGPVAAGTLSEP
ncbi:hypothetical protein V2J94_47420 [Streptomyces sp. DSM 41524]|uniref:Luciferase-like domain-containing protein n=1 Tax=Streptomyces asiaticus subsp. ignotus TaxID=3098222 RepID=A0ABU7QFG6_9ACTN|nr:hypothetical protein [Streptomyces sp. DSM 41524]